MKLLLGCGLLAVVLVAACSSESATPTPTPTVAPGATATPTTGASPSATPTSPARQAPRPTVTVVGSPSEPDDAALPPVSIDMVPTATELRPGDELNVQLTLDAHGRAISGVELGIVFDPDVLQVEEVVPGKLLGDKPAEVRGAIPFMDIDNDTGALHYIDVWVRSEGAEPPAPVGVVATVRLRVLVGASGGETTLRLTGVKVPDEDPQQIRDVDTGSPVGLRISP